VSIKLDEYKGHPTITLQDDENEKLKITFGIRKAKLILAHLSDIQRFVGNEGNTPEPEPNF
jgi:hypothetical protein